jgi:hypothetical protein
MNLRYIEARLSSSAPEQLPQLMEKREQVQQLLLTNYPIFYL